jgi:hypothetical protein
LSTERVRLFEVQEAHIALLKAAYVGWDDGEFGAPAIDCKRPYGNSSVIDDMREILGYPERDQEKYEDEALNEKLVSLHKETKVALQIALSVGYFKPGFYTAKEYSKDWEPVKK